MSMQEGKWAAAAIKAARQAALGSGRTVHAGGFHNPEALLPGGLLVPAQRLGFSGAGLGPENLHFFQVSSNVLLLD